MKTLFDAEPLGRPPGPEEVEVSLFGPGVGECIVVHVGDGRWVVIDSFLHGEFPVAELYLGELGVPLDAVVALVVTHWHDDHHKGMARLLESCEGARFYMSTALQKEEAFKVIAAGSTSRDEDFGTCELASILSRLLARRGGGKREKAAAGPGYLITGRTLLDHGSVRVEALSPSDNEVTVALRQFSDMVGAKNRTRRRLVSTSPNHASVVLRLDHPGLRALLGADLEVRKDETLGWRAVVNEHGAKAPCDLYKVAHHGSSNAQLDSIFTHLCDTPISILTTKRPQLPKPGDLDWLAERSRRVALATPVEARKPKKRERAVEKTMNSVARQRRVRSRGLGLVRVRASAGESLRVETFGDALEYTSAGAAS